MSNTDNHNISDSGKIDISPKNDETREDFKLDKILEEARYITEQEAMRKAAEKYGVRPEMDEIYSNKSKEVRLTNSNPLDLDKKVEENSAKDTPVHQEILVEQSEKEEEKPKEDSPEEIVNLTPEIPEGAQVAEDVIEDSPQFSEVNVEAGTILETEYSKPQIVTDKEQAKEEPKPENYEKIYGVKKPSPQAKTVESKVPAYKREETVEQIHIKAGRFSTVVRNEYEQYLHSKNPSISEVLKAGINKQESVSEEKDTRSKKEKMISAVVGIFSNDASDDSDVYEDEINPVDDYTNKKDEKSILSELNFNIKKIFVRTVAMSALTLFTLILVILVKAIPNQLATTIANAPLVYAVINLMINAGLIFINRITILSGLTPLAKLKGNSDTALAVASIGSALQAVVSLFCVFGTTELTYSYFTIIVSIGFLFNCIGKLFMLLRVKDNFKFLSSKTPSHAVKIYTNEDIAKKMMSGTVFEQPIIVFQHKTKFISDFLKMSYSPDPSEDMAGKLAPITVICSLVVAIVYGGFYGDFSNAINTFSIMTAVSIPLCTLIAVNVPMRQLCKNLLSHDAMISGYPSIKQFCDSNAIMIDSNDLYPKGTIKLDGIKTFANHRIDESVLAAAAVLKEAKSPMATVFNESMLKRKDKPLPEVESVLYEDNRGLVGRVKGERILVGNRSLLQSYDIEVPSADYEEKYIIEGRNVTYLAQSGELIAMFVTTYSTDKEILEELQKGEKSGLSYLIQTTDCNITSEKISDEFGLFYRSVKVLPTGLGNVCKEAQSQTQESSRAYLSTRGKLSSLIRGVSGCIRMKSNISLAIVIQLISIILGLLIVASLCLYATSNVFGTIEILIYTLFWAVASMIAPIIQKS